MNTALIHEYSNNIHNKSVVILGNYPPPLGGVSVHIKRVMHKLKNQHNQVHHFDTLNRKALPIYVIKLVWFLMRFKPDIVYYHTVDLNSRLIEFQLLAWIKKMRGFEFIVVEHNCRHLYERSPQYKEKFNILMHYVDKLVLIGNATEKSYKDNQIIVPHRTTIEAAFLPPNIQEESALMDAYPKQLQSFIAGHHTIITVNAFQLVLLNGKDLYGIDQCIELLFRLKKNGSTVGLVIVLGLVGNIQHYTALKDYIKLHDLESNCMWVMGQKELWPIFKDTTIFLRPTLSDAESVSVQEALYFKVPVVASDVCIRPAGVLTFKTGNVEDLYAKINHVCNSLHAQ